MDLTHNLTETVNKTSVLLAARHIKNAILAT
jgi:hypothetical protein